jgi:hypothetical protein
MHGCWRALGWSSVSGKVTQSAIPCSHVATDLSSFAATSPAPKYEYRGMMHLPHHTSSIGGFANRRHITK